MSILPEAKLYIDGIVRPAEGGKTFDVINPWTGGVAGQAAPANSSAFSSSLVATLATRSRTERERGFAERAACATRTSSGSVTL